MKSSAASLCFLILAAALGSPAHGSPAQVSLTQGSLDSEPDMALHPLEPIILQEGFHQPPDCCPTYFKGRIRCVSIRSYFPTNSGCSKPAVIFRTKRGQRVCANPFNADVQDCVMKLDKELRKVVEEEKY